MAYKPCVGPEPQPEVCNGLDDDCDGITDEDACCVQYRDDDADGYGDPSHPIYQCGYLPGYVDNAEDCNDLDPSANPGMMELCDGTDNDCDGMTDEGFVTGGPCTAGRGICAASGVVVCSTDGLSTVCTAQPGQPRQEACNGLDDDCDGITDENTDAACNDSNACTNDACVDGACRYTSVSCNDANVCTTDSCNPYAGCVHASNTAPCDDANACTKADTCTGGACSGQLYSCDDGNQCTTDTCNGDGACTHMAIPDCP